MAQQGLPTQTLQPTSIYAERLSILTIHQLGMTWLGVRNTITVGGFQSRIEDALGSGSLATGDPITNNKQYGASIALSHQFTRTFTMNVSADWSRIRALQAADRTIQRTARLRFNMQASPKTVVFAGARYRGLDSNVATEGNEGAVFVGLDHRL